MKDIELHISPLVEEMFPSFYKDEGTLFITFVKAYYEWLESNNQALYEARRLPTYRDIDTTIDEFIIDFKNKYLPNIQFNIASNKKLFVKNSLDFYRAKGTERAVDLFFKLIYGMEAKVQYPGDHLFKLSDNTFVKVQYLEVAEAVTNVNFVGQSIIGTKSRSVAFVERLIKIRKGSRFISVLFISGLSGDFLYGEQIETTTLTTNVTTKIVGSLTDANIVRSDPNFTVGETLIITDGRGKKGKLRVSETTNYTGVVEFELQNGGWGFTQNAEILSSDKVLNVDLTSFTNTEYFDVNQEIKLFDSIIQDNVRTNVSTVYIDGVASEIGLLTSGSTWIGLDNLGAIIFEGTLVDRNTLSDYLIFNFDYNTYPTTISGNLLDNLFDTGASASNILYLQSDPTTYITFSSWADAYTSANVIGTSNTIDIEYTLSTGGNPAGDDILKVGDILEQTITINGIPRVFANGEIIDEYYNSSTATRTMTFQRNIGAFRSDIAFYKQNGNISYDIDAMRKLNIGVKFEGGETDPIYTGLIRTVNTGTIANVRQVYGFSTRASFSIATLENEQYYSDFISQVPITDFSTDILTDTIDSSASYISGNTLANEFNFTDTAFGSIGSITVLNPGEGYAADPFFLVYEPRTFHLERYDYTIVYDEDEQEKYFRVGELIQTVYPDGQTDPQTGENIGGKVVAVEDGGAIGKIVSHDFETNTLIVTRVSTNYHGGASGAVVGQATTDDSFQFIEGTKIVGLDSSVSATIERSKENRRRPRTGLNAVVASPSFSGNGFVTNVDVIDSGYGYQKPIFNDENPEREKEFQLNAVSEDDSDKNLIFTPVVENQGIAPGYNLNRKSFLSSDKYLQDSNYYQEYSYEVLTALPFDVYKDTLVKVLHVAGTKIFGSYFATSENSIGITLSSDTSTEIDELILQLEIDVEFN